MPVSEPEKYADIIISIPSMVKSILVDMVSNKGAFLLLSNGLNNGICNYYWVFILFLITIK